MQIGSQSRQIGSQSRPMRGKSSSRELFDPGPNVRRRNVSPGLLQASDEWKTESPSVFRSQYRRKAMASRSLMPFSRNMPMSRWGEDTDPFLQMRREMNRLFDDAFAGFGLPGVLGPALRQMPAAPDRKSTRLN